MRNLTILISVYELKDVFYLNRLIKTFNSIDQSKTNIVISDSGRYSSKKIVFSHILPDAYFWKQGSYPFNKSWTINLGMKIVDTEDVIISDCDIIYGKRFYDEIKKIKNKSATFIKNNETLEVRGFGGSFFIKKSLFYHLGGFDENYIGWGREDKDFYKRVLKVSKIEDSNIEISHIETPFEKERSYLEQEYYKINALYFKNKFNLKTNYT